MNTQVLTELVLCPANSALVKKRETPNINKIAFFSNLMHNLL